MIEVETQEGVVEFPDGTPRETMEAALQQRFGRPESPSALDMIKNIPGNIKEAFTGNRRNPQNIPEVSASEFEPGLQFINFKDKLAFARGNPLAEAAIFKEQFPDKELDFDESGLPMVSTKEGAKYLNRPGFSGQDINNFLTEMAAFLSAGRAGAGAGSAALGGVGRVLGVGAASYGASLGMDEAGRILGSDQPIDHKRAAIIAALGMGGEALAPLVSKFFGRIFSSSQYVKNGVLTKKGEAALKNAGIDPRVVDSQFIKLFGKADDGVDPAVVARISQAESLKHPVKLTTGQATQSPAKQAFERKAQAGVYGDDIASRFDDAFTQQNKALQSNIDDVRSGFSAGAAEKGAGADIARTSLREGAEATKQQARLLYDKAKNVASTSPVKVLSNVHDSAKKKLLDEGFIVEGTVKDRLNQLSAFSSKFDGAKVKLPIIDSFRKSLVKKASALRGNAPDEAAALDIIKQELDNHLDAAFEAGLIKGGAAEWKEARSFYAQYAKNYKSDKIVKALVERDLTPEEASNLLFNANSLGAKSGSVQALKKIQGLVGEREWGALKEEAFLRLLRNQPKEGFSPAVYANAYFNAMKNNPSLMKTLFTQNELATLNRIANVSGVVSPMKGTTSAAGSSLWNTTTMINTFKNMFGPTGRWASEVLKRWAGKLDQGALTGLRAQAALEQKLPKVSFIPKGATGGAAAAIQSSQDDSGQ